MIKKITVLYRIPHSKIKVPFLRFQFIIYLTSLKSQKFTWQPASVCISFTKSKNILTIFNYIDLIISLFIFHIQEFHDFILFYSKIWMIYLWFFMFYQWFWWIFPDFSRFFMFNSRSWMISYYSLFKKY